MKQTSKRLLSLIMALAMILSLLPVMASAVTMTGGEVLYVTPNSNWKVDNARYAAYFFGSGEAWVSATAVDGETDLYQVTVPAGNWTNVIFCRMNPSNSTNGWDNKWNQTSDLVYDGTNNHYTVKSGTWDKGGGTWSVYTPAGEDPTPTKPTEPPVPVIALPGAFNGWDTTATMEGADGIYTMTMDLMAIDYEFKVIKDGTWMGNASTVNDDTEGIVFDASVQNNCTLKATGGTYTFTFNSHTNTLSITHTPIEGEVAEEPEYTSPVIVGNDVTFYFWSASSIKSVSVAGTMNNWDITANPMSYNEEKRIWTATISDLYNGDYAYKFVIDGITYTSDSKNNEETDADGNSLFTITEGEDEPVVTRNVTLHFQDTLDWGSVYAHIWNAGDYGTTWPGAQMEAEGGYTNWYTISTTVTTETIALIFNNGAGGEGYQTADLSISEIPETDCEYWFVPSEEGWWTGSFETDAPETYVKEETGTCDVTLHFKNTLGWEAVNGYAWTNTWPATYPIEAWPGTALTADENGWYTVSFSAVYPLDDMAVYAIFNYVTDAATVQTADLYIDCTDKTEVEKWIIPTGVQNDYLSYECDIYDAEPVETAQVNGITYYTVAEAIANANGGVIKLVNDSYVALEIAADVTIDLAGYKLDEVTVTDGYSLTLIDTAGDDYTSASCGVAYVKGTVNAFGGADGKNYLTILNSDGQYSAHRLDIAMTHISLDPNNDALGYKGAVLGDEIVQEYVTNLTISIGVSEDNLKSYTKENSGSVTLRLKNILAAGGGETPIYAKLTATLNVDGSEAIIYTDLVSTSMKETLRAVDAAWTTYTKEQQAAVQALCSKYYDTITSWNLVNVFPTVDLPIEQ